MKWLWREAKDPQRAAAMARRARSQVVVSALLLLVAFAVGYATQSVWLFTILLAAGYAVWGGLAVALNRRRRG